MVLKAYQYFFYTLYKFYESSPYSKWWSEWKAYLSIAILSIWLYSGLETSAYYIFDIAMKQLTPIIDISYLFIFTIISFINWYLFEYKNKWKKIVLKFDLLPKKNNRVRMVLVWIGIIGIIVFYFLYSIPLLGKIKYD